jgi:hypothetical protein
MTDDQIAAAYLLRKLSSLIPGYEDIRFVAEEEKLSNERCDAVIERILDFAHEMKRPLEKRIKKETSRRPSRRG